MTGFLLVMLVAAIIAARAIVIVPPDHAFVVERLGRFRTVLTPGRHVVVPFLEQVRQRQSLGELTIDLGAERYVTIDDDPVTVRATVVAQVTDPARATYAVADWQAAAAELGRTTLRKAIAARDQITVRTESRALATELVRAMQPATAGWGIEILRGEILR